MWVPSVRLRAHLNRFWGLAITGYEAIKFSKARTRFSFTLALVNFAPVFIMEYPSGPMAGTIDLP